MPEKPLWEVTHKRYGQNRKCPECGSEQSFLKDTVETVGWLCMNDDCNRFDEYEKPETTIDGRKMCSCGRAPVEKDELLGTDCIQCLSEIFVPQP